MSEGEVKFFNEKKGFGFIVTDEGDVFFHVSQIPEGYAPNKGDIVSFTGVRNERGLSAQGITLVSEAETKRK